MYREVISSIDEISMGTAENTFVQLLRGNFLYACWLVRQFSLNVVYASEFLTRQVALALKL